MCNVKHIALCYLNDTKDERMEVLLCLISLAFRQN